MSKKQNKTKNKEQEICKARWDYIRHMIGLDVLYGEKDNSPGVSYHMYDTSSIKDRANGN